MKAIIHVGMEKTGSTSIQAWLRENRAALEAEGVYPNGGREALKWIGRKELRYAIFRVAMDEMGLDEKSARLPTKMKIPAKDEKVNENYKSLTGKFEALSGKSGIFLISDEQLFRCNEFQLLALEKYLSRFFEEITYVVYIRNTVDFCMSMYSQKLNSNPFIEYNTQSYSEFVQKCMTDLVPYGLESSFGNLFFWSKVLGNRLNVRLLESDWLVKGDLIEDFASLVGVRIFEKPDRMNESFAAEYIEYVRYLNLEYRGIIPWEIRKKAIRILKKSSSGKPKISASDAQAKSIRDLHLEQEEKIRIKFFPDRPFLFSPKSYGSGIAPTPLTERRKEKIESEIRENIAPDGWTPREFACNGPRKK